MLQLFTKIESPGLRSLHSPETSSCHEAIATTSVSGLSPHSSPLSVSLASSENSAAFLTSDIRDMKNLQVEFHIYKNTFIYTEVKHNQGNFIT